MLLTAAYTTWSQQAPDEAVASLRAMRAGRERDVLTHQVSLNLVHNHYERAKEILETIGDAQLRREAAQNVLHFVERYEPEEAEAFRRRFGLHEDR